MLTKTTFTLITALVLASASSAFAQSYRQNVAPNNSPSSYNEQIRLDPAKGDIW
jgi:hypothetical protein